MVELHTVDLDWYVSTYGDARLSWVLSMLLQKFRENHQQTPEYYAQIAALSLKEDIEKEL